jgi:hypothetical protein
MSQFDPVETEFTSSTGRVFKLRELSAWEQLQADRLGGDSLTGSLYARMAAAVIELDGAEVIPRALAGEISFQALLQRLRGRDFDELAMHYTTTFNPKPADIKNESAPSA